MHAVIVPRAAARRFALHATVAALAFASVACSTSSKGSLATGHTTAPGQTTAPSPGATTGGGSSGNAKSELESLGQKWTQTQARITYRVQLPGSQSPSTSPSQFTLFWKPPSSFRMDIVTGQGSVTLISSGHSSYYCAATQHLCLQSSQASGLAAIPFISLFRNPQALIAQIHTYLSGVKVTASSQTIAGQQASCFTASGTINGKSGTAQWCFSASGLLLLLAGQGQSSTGTATAFRMEAVQASPSVSDADFKPPYPVTAIPTTSPSA